MKNSSRQRKISLAGANFMLSYVAFFKMCCSMRLQTALQRFLQRNRQGAPRTVICSAQLFQVGVVGRILFERICGT